MQSFTIKPTITTIEEVSEFFTSLSLTSTDLIVTSNSFYQNYHTQLVPAQVINMADYGKGEPSEEVVTKMLTAATAYQRVIGIGGGSVLDIAKLFVLQTKAPLWKVFQKEIVLKKQCPLVLVPTTCGTGSEVTNISIVDFPSANTKLGLADDVLFADQVYLIPQLLLNMPASVFATSSIDAFIHAIESYLSPLASSFSETFSLEAMKVIVEGYQSIVNKGIEIVPQLYSSFLQASCYAGIAFSNAGVGAVHALSYPLSSRYHICHGEANYLVFKAVFDTYFKKQPTGKIEQLHRFLSTLLDCSSNQVYQEIDMLFQSLYPIEGLHTYSMTPMDIEEMVEATLQSQQRLLARAYVPLTKADMQSIYQRSL